MGNSWVWAAGNLQHPRVLSAMAKGLVSSSQTSPANRKNRVGALVRFKGWSRQVQELRTKNSREPLYSPNFQLPLLAEDAAQWWASISAPSLSAGQDDHCTELKCRILKT